jgi:hypothetical protein
MTVGSPYADIGSICLYYNFNYYKKYWFQKNKQKQSLEFIQGLTFVYSLNIISSGST